MFRRPNVVVVAPQARTEYVTRTVHEHRAPTDESVKLLREMETKAQEQVIEAIQVGDTTFQCVVHVIQRPMDGGTLYRAVFSLNGKNMTAEHVDEGWLDIGKKNEWPLKLRDAIAKEIATAILLPALDRLPR